MARLEDQDPEHQHVIVGRSAAPGSIAPRHGALQIRPKHLEIDDRLHPFQVVAFGRKLLQTLVDIEKSRLAVHRIASASLLVRESKQTRLGQVFGSVQLQTTVAPAPRLHPNIAEAYRRKVAELHAALEADDAGPARELIRGLVESIVLMPEDGKLRMEVRGGAGGDPAAVGARKRKTSGFEAGGFG
jgi:hypothetical protein